MKRRLLLLGLPATFASSALAHPVRVGRFTVLPFDDRGTTGWVTEGGSFARNHRSPWSAPTIEPTVLWQADLVGAYPTTPLVTEEGQIIVLHAAGVSVFDRDGSLKWTRTAERLTPVAQASLHPERALCVAHEDEVFFFTAARVRSIRLSSPIVGSPLVMEDGSLIFASQAHFVRIDATGRVIFEVDVPARPRGRMARGDGFLACATGNGLLFFSASGEVQAHVQSPAALSTLTTAVGDVAYSTLATGGVFRAEPGRAGVSFEANLHLHPTAPVLGSKDGSLRVLTRAGHVVALAADGTRLWQTATPFSPSVHLSLDADGRTLVTDPAGLLFCLSGAGEVLWRYATGDRVVSPAIACANGCIVLTLATRIAVLSGDTAPSDLALLRARVTRGGCVQTRSTTTYQRS